MKRLRPFHTFSIVFFLGTHTVHGGLLRTSGQANQPSAAGVLPVRLGTRVIQRANEQLAIATSAEKQSESSAKTLLVTQQALLARMAVTAADDAFDEGTGSVPATKAAYTEARAYALRAMHHAMHAQEMLAEAKHIPELAAQTAADVIRFKIKKDAYEAAERAKPETSTSRGQRVAKSVAAAVEPYHLALLRAQKNTEETYEKAKSAMATAQRLVDQSHEEADIAQKMQSSGLAMQAQATMLQAHQDMQSAVNMKRWAEKLYNQANELNSNIGRYQLSESQAAVTAAGTEPDVIMPELPALPAI